MASDLETLLQWLAEIKVINSEEKDLYLAKPRCFVKEFSYGCILAKLDIKTKKV